MRTIEERVEELEKRVQLLEMKGEEPNYVQPKQPQPIQLEPKQVSAIKVTPRQTVPYQAPPITQPTKLSSKLDEGVVGKYIVGGLASLLVFVGAISLVALVWDKMSPEIKLALLVLVGLTLTVTGFMRIKNHKNPITSILLGTGSGLLFISILAANMAFDLISSSTAFILAGIWAIFFILSYKITQTFFTTVIAYIGSFIALLLGLSLAVSDMDYIIVIVFTISIGSALLISGYQWLSKGKQLICTLLTLLSVLSILLAGMDAYYDFLTKWVYEFAILLILMYGLANRIYKLMNDLKIIIWQLFLGILLAFITLIGLMVINNEIGYLVALFLFLLIILAQLVVYEACAYKSSTAFTVAYTLFLVVTMMMINEELFELILGVSLVTLVLLGLNHWKHDARFKVLITCIVGFDALLVLINGDHIYNISKNLPAYVCYIGIQLGVMAYLLYGQYRLKEGANFIGLKVIGFIIAMSNSFFLITNTVSRFKSIEEVLSGGILAYLFITILLITFIASGYFKPWKHPYFMWFTKNEDIPQDHSEIALYAVTSLLYFIGLIGIWEVSEWYEQMIMMVTVLAIAWVQSANLLRFKKAIKWVGIWIGLKYWILTWVILNASFDVAFDSVYYSLTGLILAILCIAIGFKIKVKSLRLYGLILTILMVVKFIAVDLSGENSITRVIALMVGGVICFGISVIYNKLNAIIST